jgi:hypothetical protein
MMVRPGCDDIPDLTERIDLMFYSIINIAWIVDNQIPAIEFYNCHARKQIHPAKPNRVLESPYLVFHIFGELTHILEKESGTQDCRCLKQYTQTANCNRTGLRQPHPLASFCHQRV